MADQQSQTEPEARPRAQPEGRGARHLIKVSTGEASATSCADFSLFALDVAGEPDPQQHSTALYEQSSVSSVDSLSVD